MKDRTAERAAELLRRHRVAALGTVRDGAPSVTMTPFALLAEPFALVVLVSGLAAHTKAMADEPRVGVLVSEPESDGLSVHALARVSIQGRARPIARAIRHSTRRGARTPRAFRT